MQKSLSDIRELAIKVIETEHIAVLKLKDFIDQNMADLEEKV